jgi:methionine-rich copper-binding protein CopC
MQIDERIQRVSMGVLGTLILLGATSAPAPPTPDASVSIPHITLEASIPEDETSVAGEVTEVRLFFSDAPLMRGASIRVVSSARKLMRSSPPAPDPEDPKQLSVQVAPSLPPGSYVVQWRCIADDGHVMRGDFRFEVTG